MMRRRLCVCVVGASACATIAAPDEDVAADRAPVAAPTTDAPTNVPVVADTPAPQMPAAVTSPLHIIARAGARLGLHPLVDGSLMVSAGPLVMRVDEAGEVLYDPSMLRGIAPIRQATSVDSGSYDGVMSWGPVGLGGRWPDAVFLSLDFTSGFRGEGDQPITYRHTPEGWTKVAVRTAHYEHHLLEMHPWKDGSVLARRGYVPWFPGQEKWDGEEGPTQRQWTAAENAIAKAKKLVVVRGTPRAPDVGPSLSAFASRATGEIFAATGGTSPSMLMIGADGARRQIDLPGDAPQILGVVTDASDRAWVFGSVSSGDTSKPYLVRVTPDKADSNAVPPCKSTALTSLSVTSDGALWTTCGGPHEAIDDDQELWTRAADGAWQRVTLPDGTDAPTAVLARAPDDVWVVASGSKGSVLLHSRPRSRIVEVTDVERLGRKLHEWNDLVPLGRHCGTGYVPLHVPPGDAAPVKAKLDADLRAFAPRASVRLVRTTLREAEALGLQLGFDADNTLADTKAVRKLAARLLGEAAVADARCWEASVADDGVLGAWERPQ